MPFEHYIGQFTAGKAMLFQHDIVPFCANARENNPRRGTAGKEFSVCVPERNTVRVLHCNSSLHRESFVASFAPSRLRHSLPSMKSKALTSKFRYQAVFVRTVVIVVLTEHRLVSATKPSRSENSTEARLSGLPSNTRPAAYPFEMERT
jgi:hypothetical protein